MRRLNASGLAAECGDCAGLMLAAEYPEGHPGRCKAWPSTLRDVETWKMNQLADRQGNPVPLHSSVDWEPRRAAILGVMQEVMGPLPGEEKRCPLDVSVEEEADCGTYLRRFITFSSEPDSRTPAYLLVPKEAESARTTCPGILCLHPTDDTVGHGVVVGLSDNENGNYASELAERGFVTIAPAYPLLANYQPDLRRLGYQSGTMKAIWDNIRCLDLLDELPYTTAGAYGTIGHSLGGHNSVYTAVFEPRIRAVVSSCGLDSYQHYMNGNITAWTSDRYMPRLKDYDLADIPFDFHDMIGALAPRHCLISAPLNDSNFGWQSVDSVVAAAARVYELLGTPTKLRLEHPVCAHDFPDQMRELAYALFDGCLRR